MERNQLGLVGVAALLLGVASCGGEDGGLPDVGGAAEELARQCGIDVDCEAGGLAEGNAGISGVASIDAFFQAVINFEGKANAVSSGIEAELDAIRADFGIAAGADLSAELQAQITANVEGELTIEAEPAKCAVDAMATLEATAKCDATVDPGTAMIECKGSCEAEVSADVQCDASAELKCTLSAPSIECTGSCQGTCEVDAMAELSGACNGTCKGSCDGTCEVVDGSGNCAGKCEGTCGGTCEFEVAASAEANCSGTCKGECTVTNPEGGCEGGIRASCEATGDAMVMCSGSCDGEFEPPMASAECQASAKAEASINVECTPPRLAVNYQLKAAVGAELEAQAKFEAALTSLVEARLPRLLASLKKANIVVDAGADLASAASGAVEGAIGELSGGANLRVVFGLRCAVDELGAVGSVISSASGKLEGQVSAAASLTAALGV